MKPWPSAPPLADNPDGDLDLIAHAPTDLEALCAEVERLRSLAAGLEERLHLAEKDADQLARALRHASNSMERGVWDVEGYEAILAEHTEAVEERTR